MKIAVVCLTLFLVPMVLSGATIQVNTTADAIEDSGACSLREAIIAANTNAPSGTSPGECPSGSSGSVDTIVLPAGTFNLTKAGSESGSAVDPTLGDLDIVQSVHVQGQATGSTVVDASSLGARVLHVDNASAAVALSNLTLRDGFVDNGYGGAIYVENGASLALTNVDLLSNYADYGGGALDISDSITVTITGSTISSNSADGSGGGIAATYGSLLTITSSTISANQANGYFSDGGGIDASGVLILTRSTVSGNDAEGRGGGLYVSGSLAASESTISGNDAGDDGGGVYFGFADSSELENCTLSGNSAGSYGGGFADYASDTISVVHSTVASNSAGISGSAMDPSDAVEVGNSLIVGTCAAAVVVSLGGNIESPGDNCGFDQPSDQVAVAAVSVALSPLADHGGPTLTHVPGAESVAVDNALALHCLPEDQRGVARPHGSGCDVGAVEVGPTPLFEDGFEAGNVSAWSSSTGLSG